MTYDEMNISETSYM